MFDFTNVRKNKAKQTQPVVSLSKESVSDLSFNSAVSVCSVVKLFCSVYPPSAESGVNPSIPPLIQKS